MSNETPRDKCTNPGCGDSFEGFVTRNNIIYPCDTCLCTGYMPQAQNLEAQAPSNNDRSQFDDYRQEDWMWQAAESIVTHADIAGHTFAQAITSVHRIIEGLAPKESVAASTVSEKETIHTKMANFSQSEEGKKLVENALAEHTRGESLTTLSPKPEGKTLAECAVEKVKPWNQHCYDVGWKNGADHAVREFCTKPKGTLLDSMREQLSLAQARAEKAEKDVEIILRLLSEHHVSL